MQFELHNFIPCAAVYLDVDSIIKYQLICVMDFFSLPKSVELSTTREATCCAATQELQSIV
jgi:hypothetical protein